jgi:hypothetical protein
LAATALLQPLRAAGLAAVAPQVRLLPRATDVARAALQQRGQLEVYGTERLHEFGVHLFGPDLKPRGRQALSAAAFAGPGGKGRDRAWAMDAAGNASVPGLK